MDNMNWIVVPLAALIPLIVGFIWYSKMLFGNAWMKSAGINEESMKGANMALIFILTYVFSFLIAFALVPIVIHQFGVMSVLANDPGLKDPNTETGKYFADFLAKYGNNFRTFKHGELHGTLTGFFIALPVIGVNALFERKKFKYIAINAGFWIICMGLMGGVLCAYL